MTGEAEYLLATLRHTHPVPPPALDWQALLDLAERHGLLMLFCRDFPGELPQEFASLERSQWTTGALMASELGRLLQEFSRRGIEALPLKGPLLASLLYGSPSLRICDDLDLLVHPRDLPQAMALLPDLGFTPAYQADDYHQSFERGNILVELHFALAPPSSPAMDLDAVWARSRVVEFRGQKARFLAPADLLMYLIIHGVKHEFARLLWVMDVNRALAELDDEHAEQVLAMAHAMGVEGALLTTCALAQQAFQVALPRRLADEIARRPAIPVRAAAILDKILDGPADPQTSHHGARLFLQLEFSARSRWVQRLRLLQPSHQDLAWAQSHHLHARWMLLLRPLRLLIKHGPGEVWRTFLADAGNGHGS
jgi:hypothetical protein